MSNRLAQFDFMLTPNTTRALGTAEFYDAGTTNARYVYGVADGTDPKYTATFDASGVLKLWGIGSYKVIVKNSSGSTLYTIDGYKCEAVSSNVVSVSGTYQATINDDMLLCNANSAGFTVTLPAAATATHSIKVKKIDSTANAVTIDGYGSELIDGGANISLSTSYVSIELFSNGSAWYSTSGSAVNADTVDGYHAGNDEGKVAVSNGTLCTNLNAQKLNGQLGSYYTNAANLSGILPAIDAGNLTLLNASNLASGTVPKAVIPAGAILQVQSQAYTTYSTLSTAIPADDTIPTSSEGTEVFSIAVTPFKTGNLLLIDVNVWGVVASSTQTAAIALFKDADAAAIAASYGSVASATNTAVCTTLRYIFTTTSTSAITFKARVGSTSGNFFINGNNSARIFGGVGVSLMTIQEIMVA